MRKGVGMLKRDKDSELGLCLKSFFLEVSGEDLNRIFISFPGVSPQGHGLISTRTVDH